MPIASTMAAATVVFVSDCRISLFLDARELGERIAELNEGRCRKARPSSETGIDCYQRLFDNGSSMAHQVEHSARHDANAGTGGRAGEHRMIRSNILDRTASQQHISRLWKFRAARVGGSSSKPAEPVVALVFPVAARIVIGNEHLNDMLGVLESEFGRHPELHG
jgi:hypothetical protein